MTAHTPGPWQTEPQSTARLHHDAFLVLEGTYTIASVYLTNDGTNGAWRRARLIAAAPDMLAALRQIELAAQNQRRLTANLAAIELIARTAIAKAEGQQ